MALGPPKVMKTPGAGARFRLSFVVAVAASSAFRGFFAASSTAPSAGVRYVLCETTN
jgi:hypothetical protein